MIKRLVLFLLIAPFLKTCNTKEKTLSVLQEESTKQIILWRTYDEALDNYIISTIQFPIEISISNYPYTNGEIKRVGYLYQPFDKYEENSRADLYEMTEEKIKPINLAFDILKIDEDKKRFLLYTKHGIDSQDSTIQNALFGYLKEMQNKQQDSLWVGQISRFKAKHSSIIKSLLSEDKIVFTFNKKTEPVPYPTGEKDTLLLQVKQAVQF